MRRNIALGHSVRSGRHLAMLAALALVLGACGGDAEQPTSSGNLDASSKDASTQDTPPVASCVGTALLPQFAAFDKECDFLGSCAGAGKCYCGKTTACGSKTPLCNPGVCTGVGTTCYCGDGCKDQPAKVPVCPASVCDPSTLPLKACDAMDYCPFVGTPPPSSCGCTVMPSHEPDCWCGDSCDAAYPRCSAAACATKNPAKCIVVPGKPLQGFHCATCGLLGNTPKCFFIQSN